MATRYKTGSKRFFGQAPLPSGYEAEGTPSDFTLPPVGVEDVDTGIFKLFRDEIALQVTAPGPDGAAVIKDVPIVLAAGEKWAMVKRGRALRDRSGSLILPLITIGRTNISQTPNDDIAGRGTNQQTGEIVIRRRLAPEDRGHQNLINRNLLTGQENVAVEPGDREPADGLTSLRELGDLADRVETVDGAWLAPERRNNVYETIVVPAPQFYTVKYDVIIWTQFEVQMNQVIEQLLSSMLPQGNAWRVEAEDREWGKKGYWFIATLDGNLYASQNNYDDLSTTERLIKYQFSLNVPAYLLASRAPGTPIPVRRYVSAPSIDFGITISPLEELGSRGLSDPYLGADDPTLPLADGKVATADQRRDGTTRLYPNRVSPEDPALSSISRGRGSSRYKTVRIPMADGSTVTRNVKIKTVNEGTGETVYSPDTDLGFPR